MLLKAIGIVLSLFPWALLVLLVLRTFMRKEPNCMERFEAYSKASDEERERMYRERRVKLGLGPKA